MNSIELGIDIVGDPPPGGGGRLVTHAAAAPAAVGGVALGRGSSAEAFPLPGLDPTRADVHPERELLTEHPSSGAARRGPRRAW